MSLFDDIFPSAPSEAFVQTQWSRGWAGQVAAFGDAADYLTENRRQLGSLIDFVGLAILYMQRHRVEVAMKAMLKWAGADAMTLRGHNLLTLWQKVELEFRPRDLATWKSFDDDHRELVEVLHRADPDSITGRYPDDNQGNELPRPAFIDLDVLQKHADSFATDALAYGDYLDEYGSAP